MVIRIAVMVLLCGSARLSQAQSWQPPGVHIIGVLQEQPGVSEAFLRIDADDCHFVGIPPDNVGFGAYYDLVQDGSEIVLRVGYQQNLVPLITCPRYATFVPIGALTPGSYSLDLIGVNVSDGGAEYDLGSLTFVVAAAPQSVPAVGVPGALWLATLLALAGARRVRHLTFSSIGGSSRSDDPAGHD